jgi:hypothetical protein
VGDLRSSNADPRTQARGPVVGVGQSGREGPAARRIETEADVDAVIELLRINYEQALEQRASRLDRQVVGQAAD